MEIRRKFTPTFENEETKPNLSHPVHVLDPETGLPAVMDVDGTIHKYDDYAGAVSVTEGTGLELKENLKLRKDFAEANGLSNSNDLSNFGRKIIATTPVDEMARGIQAQMDYQLKTELQRNGQNDSRIPPNGPYLGRPLS